MAAKPTLESIALLGEFGFEFVSADQVGEPTPGRIADRLSEIIAALEDANARGNPSAVHLATEKLKRLQQAIDVWSLLASDLDDTQAVPPAVQRPPVVAPPSVAPPPPAAALAPVPAPAPAPRAPSIPAPAVQTAPVPAPVSEYPSPLDGPIDVDQLEKAAAGTQQAFLQAIGQVPSSDDKK